MTYRFPRYKMFLDFIEERHRIYERRQDGDPRPWTTDTILATYRFCNVYRELDRVTMWIAEHWRTPFANDPNVWFMMVVARLLNFPDTLKELEPELVDDGVVRWDRKGFISILTHRKKQKKQVFNGAYIVSTNGLAKDKAIYLANDVLDPMWKNQQRLYPKKDDVLASYFSRLSQFQGMGSFMSAQVVADLKYIAPLQHADDWWTFASSGPGSRKGMSYLMTYDPEMTWREHEWREALADLQVMVDVDTRKRGLDRIHAQDLQNCLCEFSKYMRTTLGTGRPKSKFSPML